MKKAFVLALALVLTMGLAVPAAAVGTASPTAPTTSTTTTAPLPEVTTPQVTAEDGTVIVVDPVASDDIKLTEEEKTALAAAQAALADAAPAGMKAQYFFYVRVYAQDDATKKVAPVTITIKLEGVTEVVVKQFVDSKWVELKSTINGDGTVTIEGVVDAPMAIFTK